MGYGRCRENGKSADGCGTGNNNTVGVWRSKTLASGSWELLSSFTPSKSGWPVCTYFRSHALRSEATGKYVLWLNAQHCDAVCPSGSKGKCFVAGVSDVPEGPFTFSGIVKNVRYVGEGGVGDFALFQDDDSSRTAYIIYKRSGEAPGVMAHRMTLQRLEPSLLSASPAQDASAGIIGAPFVEVPSWERFVRASRAAAAALCYFHFIELILVSITCATGSSDVQTPGHLLRSVRTMLCLLQPRLGNRRVHFRKTAWALDRTGTAIVSQLAPLTVGSCLRRLRRVWLR